MGSDAVRGSPLPESVGPPAVGFGIVGLVLVQTGRSRRARYLGSRETVRLRLEMTESSRRLFVLSTLSAFGGAGGLETLRTGR